MQSAYRARSVGDELRAIEGAVAELLRMAASPQVHEARLRATGLTISRTQFRFLRRLEEHGPGSVSQLAYALEVSQPTASRTLSHLESDGLVERRADRRDGRVALFDVTAKGRRVIGRLRDHMHLQLSEALEGMSASRRRELAGLLDELVDRLR